MCLCYSGLSAEFEREVMTCNGRSVLQEREEAILGGLDEHRVMVRWLPVDDDPRQDLSGFLALLDPTEQARAARFHADQDRRAYILAHALTRLMLSSRRDRPPQDWRFEAGHHGKPRIVADDGEAGLLFNLSHTRGMVAVALADGQEVGIDVERIESGRLSLDLAVKTFAPSEAAYLCRLPAESQTEAALTLWTLKEAYIKATGQGLSCPLDSFAMTLDPLSINFKQSLNDDPAKWRFRTLQPHPGFVLALALRASRQDRLRIDARGLTRAGLSDEMLQRFRV